MSVIEPIEEKVMSALAFILGNLDGVRPGGWVYPRTPTVDRILPPINAQMSSATLPRLFIVPARASTLRPAGSSGVYNHHLEVDIMGVVEATDLDTTLADTWRWRLRQDVLEQLHLHITLDGNAHRIEFHTRPEQVDAGETGSKVWFLQPLTVLLFAQKYELAA
jgi:hypothetical protein